MVAFAASLPVAITGAEHWSMAFTVTCLNVGVGLWRVPRVGVFSFFGKAGGVEQRGGAGLDDVKALAGPT